MCGRRKGCKLAHVDSDVDSLIAELVALRGSIVAECAAFETRLQTIHSNFRDSARNLLHYLALRRHDLRPLQVALAALGLSSLGRPNPRC